MWYVFAIFWFSGMFMNLFLNRSEKAKEGTRKHSVYSTLASVFIGITLLCGFTLILYLVGWVWYFLGGWLVVDCAESFWDYIVYGFISLMGIVLISGLIMIICGKDPMH